MQVFEFHFNPREKEDLIFDTFCYEPDSSYERRMGHLYMVGLLRHALPKQNKFLDNLAQTIKEKYYKTTAKKPNKALKETLKKANEFLEEITKEGDVNWLGNLNFSVLSIKNFDLNFTKVGNFKIILLRKGQIIDIDKKLQFEGIEPYPLKVFGSIVAGKIAENDILLVLNKEVFDSLQKQKLLQELAQASIPITKEKIKGEIVDLNRIKVFFNQKRDQLLKTAGLALVIVFSKDIAQKEIVSLGQKQPRKSFSLEKTFKPVIASLTKRLKIKKPSININLPKPSKPRTPSFKIKLPAPKIKIPKQPNIRAFFLKKEVLLIVSLSFFLTIGFLIFDAAEQNQLKGHLATLDQIKERVEEANTYLILADSNPQAKKEANILLQESLEDLTPLINIAYNFPKIFAEEVTNLQEIISKNLYELNGLIILEEPEPFFEIPTKEFVPQKITYSKETLYFFSSYSNNVFSLDKENKGQTLSVDNNFQGAAPLTDYLLFFSKPDQIIKLEDNEFKETFTILPPYSEYKYSFTDFTTYNSSLYFLDKENGRVLKYPFISDFHWGQPQSWLLAEATENAIDFKSMTVDGSVWILTKDNKIKKYFGGSLQKTLDVQTFPQAKTFSKIYTKLELPYLYLLEPAQQRIVLLNKTGEVYLQYQSESFDNLLDFTVTADGVIYLLNGQKVYKIAQ